MNHFFLLNEAVDLKDYKQFKNGMLELNVIEREREDVFLKHESIWWLDILSTLCTTFGQEEQLIVIFVERMKTSANYFISCEDFDQTYPNNLNAFLGIDFSKTFIEIEKQIVDTNSFYYTKKHYYSNLLCNGEKDKMRKCLSQLYKNYTFDDKALEDITYWNHINFSVYLRVHELLVDIKDNPFQGGIGKTEVLKNKSGIASKRLDDEHRITYQLENSRVYVRSCKGHYE
ncbi:MAG: Txe/YoeB family addiction module toxin [Prevotella sp.]|jgi:toxin YoeB|nr:Txe/YoeB family addiction module toxin [Prevotella sp.]